MSNDRTPTAPAEQAWKLIRAARYDVYSVAPHRLVAEVTGARNPHYLMSFNPLHILKSLLLAGPEASRPRLPADEPQQFAAVNPYDIADSLLRRAASRRDLTFTRGEADAMLDPHGFSISAKPLNDYFKRYGIIYRDPSAPGGEAFTLSSDGFVYISLGGFRGVIFRQRARSLSSWVGLATGLASSLVALFTAAVPWARWLCGLLALGAAAVLGFLIYQAVYTARIDKGLHVDVSLDEDDNKQDAR